MNSEKKEPAQEKVLVNTRSLKDLAIYLSGIKDGKGNLLPLGTIVLDDLWNAIKYLQGDVRYVAERDKALKDTSIKVYPDKNPWDIPMDEKKPLEPIVKDPAGQGFVLGPDGKIRTIEDEWLKSMGLQIKPQAPPFVNPETGTQEGLPPEIARRDLEQKRKEWDLTNLPPKRDDEGHVIMPDIKPQAPPEFNYPPANILPRQVDTHGHIIDPVGEKLYYH